MNLVALFLCLATGASALNILEKKQAEVTTEHSEGVERCKSGTWKWSKRNSSALRETPKKVEKIFYLNVQGSVDRDHHMKHELKVHAPHTPSEKFSAFKASTLNKHEKSPKFKEVATKYSKGRYTPWLLKDASKEVFAAIHITNYQVMEHIMKTDPLGDKSDNIYMVLEDDSNLDANWYAKLPRILENIPAEWDILRIGYWGAARCEDKENNYVYAIQPPAKDVKALGDGHFYSGNTGYLVRPKSVPRILDIMRNSSFASIENVLMYPHRFPDGTDQQVLSYAVAPEHMLVRPAGYMSSHA